VTREAASSFGLNIFSSISSASSINSSAYGCLKRDLKSHIRSKGASLYFSLMTIVYAREQSVVSVTLFHTVKIYLHQSAQPPGDSLDHCAFSETTGFLFFLDRVHDLPVKFKPPLRDNERYSFE
jgi:hypothetical protein